jgi:hypothetical protein
VTIRAHELARDRPRADADEDVDRDARVEESAHDAQMRDIGGGASVRRTQTREA